MANALGLDVKPVTEYTAEEVERVKNWINSEEYKEKNFARQALVINPAHACQPLGGRGRSAPARRGRDVPPAGARSPWP